MRAASIRVETQIYELSPKKQLGRMKRLSAQHFGALKYVFPFALVIGAGAWGYWSDVRGGEAKSFWFYFLLTTAASLVTAVVFRRNVWVMADTVELSDDSLTIRRWTTTEVIPLSGIKHVAWEPYVVGSVVTVELSSPSAFGSAIQFLAPDSRKVPTITFELESLAARVQSAVGRNVA